MTCFKDILRAKYGTLNVISIIIRKGFIFSFINIPSIKRVGLFKKNYRRLREQSQMLSLTGGRGRGYKFA